MKYDIKYEGVRDGLNSEIELYSFEKIKAHANLNKIELSEEDFLLLMDLCNKGEDVRWMINYMVFYKKSLKEALVKYIIC